MSFQAPLTINDVIEGIKSHRYFLPAIQREFVWRPSQITRLFDSLMRGYPINSFLFWQVEEKNKHRFKFYRFINTFRQRYDTHNPEARMDGIRDFLAVLDGQQRLTSLFLGLTGTYSYKRYRARWEESEHSFPTRKLFLNVSRPSDKPDMEYHFRFLIDRDTPLEDGTPFHRTTDGELYFLAGRILDFPDDGDLDELLDRMDFGDTATTKFSRKTLRLFRKVIHDKPTIHYYLEKDQDLNKVVDMFIRTNAGGTRLSFSDLLLSMATAGWKKGNARKEITGLVDEINRLGFSFDKDFVLKALLVLFSKNIRFRISNFDHQTIERFEQGWYQVPRLITTAVKLVKRLGFDTWTLASHNALIPIIYYLHRRELAEEYETAVAHAADRKRVEQYLHLVLLAKLFSGQADAVLTRFRRTIDANLEQPGFPLRAIQQEFRDRMPFGRDAIEDLLKNQKDDRYAFSILALLYPHLDYDNRNFHKDHLHPISAFDADRLQDMGIPEDRLAFYLNREHCNAIVNLQLLDANENEQKSDLPLVEWVANRDIDLDRQLIPRNVSLDLTHFEEFIAARKALLVERLERMMRPVADSAGT